MVGVSLPSFDVTDPAAKAFYDERGWVLIDTLEAAGVVELRAWVDEIAAWPELGPGSPGGVLAKKVTLTTGRYTLYCTLVGGTPPGTPGESHAAAGMTATLTIVAP